jgi:hypothetical protein
VKRGIVGTFGPAREMVELAVLAEQTGWDGFFSWDGISIGTVDTFDPWVLLGAIASRTERITLGAMLFALPRQQPWKVARESLTVDHLSVGRLVMPVGLGAVDDAGFSRVSGGVTDRKVRAELLDDSLAILGQAWTGEPFSYAGTHHAVTDIVFAPRPVAQPRIPVWVVGGYPALRSLRRAISWDGMIVQRLDRPPMSPLEPEDVAEVAEWISVHRDTDAPFDVIVEGKAPSDPTAAADRMLAFEQAGATWWMESHWDGPNAAPAGLRTLIAAGPPGLS